MVEKQLSKRQSDFAVLEDDVRWLVANTPALAQRAGFSAELRGRASQLKVKLETLSRQIDGLEHESKGNAAASQKATELKREVQQALATVDDVQQRFRAAAAGPSPMQAAAGAAPGDFVRLPSGPLEPGAELQPVSQRAMLQQQQATMRSFDAPLAQLEGTVSNLQSVGNMISSEISLHNRMLDQTNQDAERAHTRLNRANRALTRFSQADRNRCLTCSVLLLLIVLVVIFIWEVLP